MASSIDASTSGAGGVITTADNTGILQLKSGGTTIATISSTGLQQNVGAPAFSAYQSSNQTITNNSWTKVQINTEEFDTNSNYDNVTNYRFTPTVAGYYQINGATSINDTPYYGVSVYKNGSIFKQGNFAGAYSSAIQGAIVSCLVYLNGSTDYVELYIYQSSGVSKTTSSGSHLIYFQGSMIRSA